MRVLVRKRGEEEDREFGNWVDIARNQHVHNQSRVSLSSAVVA